MAELELRVMRFLDDFEHSLQHPVHGHLTIAAVGGWVGPVRKDMADAAEDAGKAREATAEEIAALGAGTS